MRPPPAVPRLDLDGEAGGTPLTVKWGIMLFVARVAVILCEGRMVDPTVPSQEPPLLGWAIPVVQQIVHRLVDRYQPQQIILFGSLAYGEPNADSDIDLLIIKETHEPPLARRIRVRQLVFDPERRIPFSPLVLTPEELSYRLSIGDPFYREILERGKVLYARS